MRSSDSTCHNRQSKKRPGICCLMWICLMARRRTCRRLPQVVPGIPANTPRSGQRARALGTAIRSRSQPAVPGGQPDRVRRRGSRPAVRRGTSARAWSRPPARPRRLGCGTSPHRTNSSSSAIRSNSRFAAPITARARAREATRRTDVARSPLDRCTSAPPTSPHVSVEIDRAKAEALGLPYADVSTAVQTVLGFVQAAGTIQLFGRIVPVIVQIEPMQQTHPDALNQLRVRNNNGEMIPLATGRHGSLERRAQRS